MMKWYEEKMQGKMTIASAESVRLQLSKIINFREIRGRDAKLTKELKKSQESALRERRMISRRAAKEPGYAGLICSADDAVSLTINCEDHLRMQISHGLTASQISG